MSGGKLALPMSISRQQAAGGQILPQASADHDGDGATIAGKHSPIRASGGVPLDRLLFDFSYPEPKPKDHDGDNKQHQNFNQIDAPSSAQPDGNIHYTERKPYNGDYAGQPVNILSKNGPS